MLSVSDEEVLNCVRRSAMSEKAKDPDLKIAGRQLNLVLSTLHQGVLVPYRSVNVTVKTDTRDWRSRKDERSMSKKRDQTRTIDEDSTKHFITSSIELPSPPSNSGHDVMFCCYFAHLSNSRQ
jgi:hypothetical protein